MAKDDNELEAHFPEPVALPPEPLPIDEKTQEALDKMILDSGVNKYDLIILARRWAYELKAKEGEHRAIQSLIPEAIRDVLTGKVDPKTIKELPQLKSLVKKLKGPTVEILENIGKNSDKDSEKETKSKKK